MNINFKHNNNNNKFNGTQSQIVNANIVFKICTLGVHEVSIKCELKHTVVVDKLNC